MTKITIYPTTIATTTGRSTKTATQMLSNPQALTSENKNLAYWGVKNPTYLGIYIRNYPDSITSRAGSFYTPETFYAKGFNIKEIPNEVKIKNIYVEYSWEQISYSSLTAFGTFDKPSIILQCGSEKINEIKGAIPEKNRYNNNKTNPDKQNTNSAILKSKHTQILYQQEYSNKKLTGKDLKNINIKFVPAKNTSSNYVRIVMQYIRIIVDFEDNPLIHISSRISKEIAAKNEEFEVEFTINPSNEQFSPTQVSLSYPSDLELIDFNNEYGDAESEYDLENKIWTVNKLNDVNDGLVLKDSASIILKFRASKIGVSNISAELNNNRDSIKYKTNQEINIIQNTTVFSLSANQTLFDANLKNELKLNVVLNRTESITTNFTTDYILIDTDKLITKDKGEWHFYPDEDIRKEEIDEGLWKFYINNKKNIKITGTAEMDKVGDYNIQAIHQENYEQKIENLNIVVLKKSMSKDYFKLRLEDGSDVRYNSLVITEGDDLINPLTYEIKEEDNILNYLIINGYDYRIPTNTAKMIYFDLKLDTDKDISFNNTIGSIEVFNQNGKNMNDIVVGSDDNIFFFESDSPKYFSINSISSNKNNKIGFIVISEIEQECIFKIKIFDEDKYEEELWTPTKILFKDVPSIKLKIEGKEDLQYDNDEENELRLDYIIENKSDIDGKDLKFKIIEPSYFKKIKTNNEYEIYIDGVKYTESEYSQFSPLKNIWKFPTLPANDVKHILSIKYKATKKGIYKFILQTLDNEGTFEDDQYFNTYVHNVMVNIKSNVEIVTTVSNRTPEIKELFDYNINLKNFSKVQENFILNIYDIGVYDENHSTSHYEIEDILCEYGIFTPSYDDSNKIGTWELNEIGKNKEYNLNLSLNPIETGPHTIQCVFLNKDDEKYYNNKVVVKERNNRVSFNVYHAIGYDNENCSNCDNLTEICDDDFIPIGDDFYYVIKITNNERNPISDLKVKTRLPKSFLGEYKNLKLSNILCSSQEYLYDNNTELLSFFIPQINGCETKTICLKIKPDKIGEYNTTFVLSGYNMDILSKTLKLTVSSLFPEKKLEHQISIYNFEKTNRYFRYEIDNKSNIYKFFNRGDKSHRLVDIENYNVSKIEEFKGTNLKQLYRKINQESKYVEAEFLRIGNNDLKDKGYELYPDGFIRRFGLLNSEVFHYSGQLPKIGNLVDYAMRWDIDKWSTKVWTGENYSNGVFDLSIDYSKIPKNFMILEKDKHPIASLQGLVDRVKPYGTKGICYYSNTTLLDMSIYMSLKNFTSLVKTKMEIDFENIGLISWYDRYDGSLAISYDIIKYNISNFNFNLLNSVLKLKAEYERDKLQTEIDATCDFFNINIDKVFYSQCEDIFENIDNSNEDNNFDIIETPFTSTNLIYDSYLTSNNNDDIDTSKDIIVNNASDDITSKYVNILSEIPLKDTSYIFSFENNDPINETELGIVLKDEENYIRVTRCIDKIKRFNGFRLYYNNDKKEEINFGNESFVDFKILLRIIPKLNYNLYYFSVEKNNSNKFYYLGRYKDSNKSFKTYGICCLRHKEIDEEVIYHFNNIKEVEIESPLSFHIKETPNTLIENFDDIITTKWNNPKNIFKKNKYTILKNNSDIDKVCIKGERKIKTPLILLKSNNINLKKLDEITDISLLIKAQSNKKDFINDLNVSFNLDGDNYIPIDNIKKIKYYPNNIENINREFNPQVYFIKNGITICNECLKTSSGYYDVCQYCGSEHVTHSKNKTDATYCHECGWIETGWSREWLNEVYQTDVSYCNSCEKVTIEKVDTCPYCGSNYITQYDYKTDTITCCCNDKQSPFVKGGLVNRCSHCLSSDIEYIKIDYNKTYCNDCHSISNEYYNACPKCFSTNVTHLTNSENMIDFLNQYDNDTNLKEPIIIQSNDKKIKFGSIIIPLNKDNSIIYELDTFVLNFVGKNLNKEGFYYCQNCNNIGFGHPDECEYCQTSSSESLYYSKNSSNIILTGVVKIGNTYEKMNINEFLNDDFNISIDLIEWIKKNPYSEFSIDFYIENLNKELVVNEIDNLDISDSKKRKLINKINMMDIIFNDIKFNSHYKNETEWNISKFYGDDRFGAKYIVPSLKDETDYIKFSNFNIPEKNKKLKHAYLNINGINKSYSYNNCFITVITDKQTYNFQKYTIPGFINIKIDLLDKLSDTEINNNLKIKINFRDTKSQDEIIITNVDINIEKIDKTISYPIETNNNIKWIKDKNSFLVSSVNNELWRLKKNLPNYLTGRQLENNLTCLLNFGELDIDEYIKIYDIQLLITYKIKKAEYSTEYIDVNDSNSQLIIGDLIKNKGELFGSVKEKLECLNNLDSSIVYNKNIKSNYIPLNKTLCQSFIANTESISGIGINTFGKNGYPSDEISIAIYDDEGDSPNNLLAQKNIDGWNFNGEYVINFNVNDLNIGEKYWIVIEDKSADENNHYKIKYNNNHSIGQLILKNNSINKIEDYVISFSLYTDAHVTNYNSLPSNFYLDEGSFKVNNILFKYNIIQNNKVYIKNLKIKQGVRNYE